MKSRSLRQAVMPDNIPPWVVLVDTETVETSDDGRQDLLLGRYELWRVSTRTGIPCHRSGPKLKGAGLVPFRRGLFFHEDELYQLLRSLKQSRCIAHNWQYDASVIRLGSKTTRRKHGYFIDMDNGTSFPIDKGYAPFSVRIGWGGEDFTHFLDNTNFHKTSLANLGESFGLAKLPMPDLYPGLLADLEYLSDEDALWLAGMDANAMAHLDPPARLATLVQVIRYCTRDVEVLREAWFSLFRFSWDLAKVTPGITVASMAKRCYQRRWLPAFTKLYKEKFVGNLNNPFVADAEEQAFHGGRTDVFWQGKVPGDGVLNKYDVNSMYPSCMVAKMPVQLIGGTTAEALFTSIAAERGPIHLAKVTVSIPATGLGWLGWEGVKIPGRGLTFPAGRFTAWAWQPMLAIAAEQGWIQRVHNVIAYRPRAIFKQYVHDVYALRAEAKAAGDAPRSLLLKYLLNSLYGKFGQRRFGSWKQLEGADLEQQQANAANGDGFCRWQDLVEGNPEAGFAEYLETEGKIYRFEPAEEGMGDNSICSIAGFITAMARAKLWRAMAVLLEQGNTVHMTDTDSIVTDGHLPASMVGKTLGQWDLEETSPATGCSFHAPKHYTFNEEAKIKGVRNALPGVSTYQQAQFSRWQTDFLSKNPERRARLESGAFVGTIIKEIAGHNLKRVSQGDGRSNLPLVLPLEQP